MECCNFADGFAENIHSATKAVTTPDMLRLRSDRRERSREKEVGAKRMLDAGMLMLKVRDGWMCFSWVNVGCMMSRTDEGNSSINASRSYFSESLACVDDIVSSSVFRLQLLLQF